MKSNLHRNLVILSLAVISGILFVNSILFASAPVVTLTSPNGTSYNLGDTMSFSGNIDTGGATATDLALVVKDQDGNYIVQQTKTNYFLDGYGASTSAVYLNQYPVTSSPVYIIDKDLHTCSSVTVGMPCNLFSTTTGSVIGGYWTPTGTSTYATITFDKTFKISSFSVSQHSTLNS